MTKREQILAAISKRGRTKTPDQWAVIFHTSRQYVQFVASRAGLDHPFSGRRHPRFISITYRPGKFRPLPGVTVPCTAIRAAGFNGERKLRLTVEKKNRRIVLQLV